MPVHYRLTATQINLSKFSRVQQDPDLKGGRRILKNIHESEQCAHQLSSIND